jgi:hypothetical protein
MEASKMQTEVAVQRTATGKLLGLCIAIPAESVEDYADKETIKFEITTVEDGFMLKVVE